MALASELLWLGQLLDSVAESDPHGATVATLAVRVEAVRDALYELYCDAADERMQPHVAPDTSLERHVRDCYAWCGHVAGLLGAVTGGLRQERGPDWAAARAGFRLAASHYAALAACDLSAVRSLAIDFRSPVEPLRNLPADLARLAAAIADLHTALDKRFG